MTSAALPTTERTERRGRQEAPPGLTHVRSLASSAGVRRLESAVGPLHIAGRGRRPAARPGGRCGPPRREEARPRARAPRVALETEGACP